MCVVANFCCLYIFFFVLLSRTRTEQTSHKLQPAARTPARAMARQCMYDGDFIGMILGIFFLALFAGSLLTVVGLRRYYTFVPRNAHADAVDAVERGCIAHHVR